MEELKENHVIYHRSLGRGIVVKTHPNSMMVTAIFDCDGLTSKGKRLKRAVPYDHLEDDTNESVLDKLVNKDMITLSQSDTLDKMIQSPDSEVKTVGEELINIKIKDALLKSLNNDQTEAFNSIIQYIDDEVKAEAFVLKGYAGTGKTFLISRVIEYIGFMKKKYRIVVTAPTNKAVNVLKDTARKNKKMFNNESSKKSRIEYKTIHSLLGLKQVISEDGVQSFVPDYESKSDIQNYQLLIVDETSMLDDRLFKYITEYNNGLKIIYMGDPAQIPPVNASDPIPFRTKHAFNFITAELKEIMRQKGEHPIVDHSFTLRDNLAVQNPIPKLETKIRPDGQGLVYLNSVIDKNKMVPLLNKYFNNKLFDNDPDYMKVIAWRNVTVNQFNNIVRRLIFGTNVRKYEKGDKLIVNSPIFEIENNKYIKFTTSEELEVISVQIKDHVFYESGITFKAKIYSLDVHCAKWESDGWSTLYIIHESSMDDYKALLKRVKTKARLKKDVVVWKAYYNIKAWSSDVSYNYAITAHKSQGSTYENVLLLEDDINLNKKTIERNRIKYTAYTRASKKLFIYRNQ